MYRVLNCRLVCDVRVGLWTAAGISMKVHTPQLHLSTPSQSKKMVQQPHSILVRESCLIFAVFAALLDLPGCGLF